MRKGFVADSSLGIAWVIASQSDEETERLRDDAIDGAPITVPVLWTLEIGNALLMLVHRNKMPHPEYTRALHQLFQVTVVLDEEAPRLALTEIARLAEKHSLTTYDATYLELAMRRGLPLASRDAALNKAAKKCGVATLL